jgi:hypothetical protein
LRRVVRRAVGRGLRRRFGFSVGRHGTSSIRENFL